MGLSVDFRNSVGRIRGFSGVFDLDGQKECAARSVDAGLELPSLFDLEVGVAPNEHAIDSFHVLVRDFLRHGFRLHEQQQVISSASLGVRARHVESAKRMRADHRTGAFAIQIEIADMKRFPRLLELLGIF